MAVARKGSQVITHMVIGFAIAYAVTGSVALSGLVMLVEPVMNVLLAPFHEKAWEHIRRLASTPRRYLLLGAEKLSLTMMHIAVAFTTFYVITGSGTFGGLVVLLEAVTNVLLMPLHNRLWDNLVPRREMRIA